MKHGLYSSGCYIDKAGRLIIYKDQGVVAIPPGKFELRVDGATVDVSAEGQKQLSDKLVEILIRE